MKRVLVVALLLFILSMMSALELTQDNSLLIPTEFKTVVLVGDQYYLFRVFEENNTVKVERKVVNSDLKEISNSVVYSEKKQGAFSLRTLDNSNGPDNIFLILKNGNVTRIVEGKPNDPIFAAYSLKTGLEILHANSNDVTCFDAKAKTFYKYSYKTKATSSILNQFNKYGFSKSYIFTWKSKGLWLFKKHELTIYNMNLDKVGEVKGIDARIFNQLSPTSEDKALVHWQESGKRVAITYFRKFWFFTKLDIADIDLSNPQSIVLNHFDSGYFSKKKKKYSLVGYIDNLLLVKYYKVTDLKNTYLNIINEKGQLLKEFKPNVLTSAIKLFVVNNNTIGFVSSNKDDSEISLLSKRDYSIIGKTVLKKDKPYFYSLLGDFVVNNEVHVLLKGRPGALIKDHKQPANTYLVKLKM